MAPIFTPVSAIVAGKINIKLKVRVINLWIVPDYTKPNEDSSIHMLLIDEQLGKIQATGRKNLVPKIKSSVDEGSAYVIENVLVTHNDPKYKTTQHRYKLTIIDRTKWTKLDECAIPINHFDFVSFNEILVSDREDLYVDVIGHVVERDDLKEKIINGRTSKLIDITLQDAENNRIHCSLWGQYAERIHSFMTNADASSPMVVVLQMCKLKKYYGQMGVSNAFYGTKLILGGDLIAVKEYRNRIEGVDVMVTQGVSQVSASLSLSLTDDMLQTRKMTIEDLIESSDPCSVIVLATICGIESDYGWYYEACTKCAARVKVVAGRMYCPRCKQGRNAVPRYKVHVQVMDTTGSTTFIMFDRNVQHYVGRSVQDLIEAQVQGNNSCDYPTDLDIFVGKQMLFKVEITDGNLMHNWRNYAVKRTSDDVNLITQFAKVHKIKICNEETEAAIADTDMLILADEAPLEKRLIEGGDSSKTDGKSKDNENTPSSKVVGKRLADTVGSINIANEVGEVSTNKPVKVKCIKIEKD